MNHPNPPYGQPPPGPMSPMGQPPMGQPPMGPPPMGPPPMGPPPMGQPPMGTGPMPGPAGYGGSGYEFTTPQNAIIGKTAMWAKGLAIVMFIEAFLQLVNANVIGIIVHVAVGVFFWRSGTSLSSVVETAGHDVPHLMEALQQLGSALLVRLILMGVLIGLLVLVSVIVVAVFLSG